MRHLSLFAGSGIGSLAAQAAGIVTVAHAENDPACCYCLERLWPDARLFRDVRDVTAESVADLGPIDIISGGFPCQDVSTAGKGEGLGTEENPTRSGLWYEFARVIREVQPAWVLIENVPALRNRGGDRVCFDLEAMGYTWESVVVGAWAVGAPHKRDRVWIVGRLANDSSQRSGQRKRQREPAAIATGSKSGTEGLGSLAGLADPIGNLCGRGGDESERGPEGRTAAGRTGETVDNNETRKRGTECSICSNESGGCNGHSTGSSLQPFAQSGFANGSPCSGDSPCPCWRDGTADKRFRSSGHAHHGLSSELGHTASDDQRRAPVAAMHGEGEPVGGSSGGCGELADAGGERRQEPGGMYAGTHAPTSTRSSPSRWPSRPGEPQHAFEAPRLVEFGVGDAADGLSRRVRSRANKAALRMVGNAWCYPVAEMMFRAIVDLDATL